MRMADRAPGLTRPFDCESWGFMPAGEMRRLREEAKARFDPARVEGIAGSDIDPQALELARRHIAQAGLAAAYSCGRRTCATCGLRPAAARS